MKNIEATIQGEGPETVSTVLVEPIMSHLGSTIVMSPPLVITRPEIDRVVAVLDGAIAELGQQLGRN